MSSSQDARVAECLIPECLYNRASRCYARAITVSMTDLPECRTFYAANGHAPRRPNTAIVGACTACGCRYNADFLCEADVIFVGYTQSETIGCLTYSP